MKILHTIAGMSVKSGGPTACTYNLLKSLNGLPDVTAYLLTYDVRDKRKDCVIGEEPFFHLVPAPIEQRFAYSPQYQRAMRSHTGYELIHAHGLWQYPTHAAATWARQSSIPYIIAPHGMLYPQALRVKPYYKKLMLSLYQRKDLEKAACIQVTCRAEMEHVRSLGFTNPIAIVPNALDSSSWLIQSNGANQKDSANRRSRIGFVGRLHPIKNIDRLIQAWGEIAASYPQVELALVGEGDAAYQAVLEELISSNKIENVMFYGFQQGEQLQQLVASFDFLVLPSKSENFGMVVPEALAYGTPVIASKGTPWEELNIHRCGWWVDNDIETLVKTIEIALSLSLDERTAMGERGRHLILANYSAEEVAKKMRLLYEWILREAERPYFVYL